MNWFKEHIAKFVGGLVLVIVGFLINVWWNYDQSKIQYLDYNVSTYQSILKGAREVGDTIKFTVNGKEVDDISELDISFHNYSRTDFENIDVFVDFNGSYYKKVLSVNYFDQNSSKELISEIAAQGKEKDHRTKYGYTVKMINRREDTPGFSIKFLFDGDYIPDYKIYVNKSGVDVRPYSKYNYTFFPEITLDAVAKVLLYILPVFGVIILSLQFWFERMARKQEILKEKIEKEDNEIINKF